MKKKELKAFLRSRKPGKLRALFSGHDILLKHLNEFLNSDEVESLHGSVDIPYQQFKSFLKNIKEQHLLDPENLSHSRAANILRRWYNENIGIPCHLEWWEGVFTFLKRNDLASLRRTSHFFSQMITNETLLNGQQEYPTAEYNHFDVHHLCQLKSMSIIDFILLPQNLVAVSKTRNDTLSKMAFPIEIYNGHTNEIIHKLPYPFKNEPVIKLGISEKGFLFGVTRANIFFWDSISGNMVRQYSKGVHAEEKKLRKLVCLEQEPQPQMESIDQLATHLMVEQFDERSTKYNIERAAYLPSGNIIVHYRLAGLGKKNGDGIAIIKFSMDSLQSKPVLQKS